MISTQQPMMKRAASAVRVCKYPSRHDLSKVLAGAAAIVLSTGSPALAGSVSFPTIPDGASVSTPATVDMAVDGMEVRPAKDGLEEGTGHFHLLIDVAEQFPYGEAIPFDETHLHFGKGQTTTQVPLSPGKHQLTLQFANAVHQSYGPEYRTTVTVEAKAAE